MSDPNQPDGWGSEPGPPPSAWGQPQGYPSGPPPTGWGGGPPALPPGTYLDQASGLVLPNGTQLASVGRRIGGRLLGIPLFVVTLGIGYIVWGLVVWGRGQTPTQQVLGMRCYRPETGRVAGWGWMAMREIVGYIAETILSIVTLLVSFILFLARRDHRSLEDLIAGTVVLHDPNKVLAGR